MKSKIEIVYKYRDWKNDFHKRVLLNNELYLSTPKDFNDPFDCRITENYNLFTPEEEDKYINELLISSFPKTEAKGLDLIFVYKQPQKIVLLSSIAIARLKDGYDPVFYRYFLLSPDIQSSMRNNYVSGFAIPRFVLKDFRNVPVPILELNAQKSIAFILSSLDDKIDLLHRQNATLEKMAETLLRQWFVEEAKEDWQTGKLPDEFDCVMGASPPGESYNEEGKGISMFQGNAEIEFRFPKKRVYTTDPKRFAEKFDTLISLHTPVGEQNMASERCCIGRGVAAFRYKANNKFYTYTYFKMESIMEEIKQFNETGTVFGSISKSDFENLSIVIPDKEIVIKFQNEVNPIDKKLFQTVLKSAPSKHSAIRCCQS